jgi:hypothetical protein
MATLKARAWLSLAGLAVVMSLLLFGFAGTIRYWHAWVYLALFFGLSAVITLDLLHRDPALLERRMKGGPTAEPRPMQRVIMMGASPSGSSDCWFCRRSTFVSGGPWYRSR